MNKILSILIIISIAFLSISMVSAANADHAITSDDHTSSHKTQHLIDNYNKIHGPNPNVIIASLWEHRTMDDIIEMEQQNQ